MLERVDRTYTKDEVMGLMEPLISTWFNERFDDLTIPQAKAIPIIHQRRNVLVSSPTGSSTSSPATPGRAPWRRGCTASTSLL